jgi:hypothetical protein
MTGKLKIRQWKLEMYDDVEVMRMVKQREEGI